MGGTRYHLAHGDKIGGFRQVIRVRWLRRWLRFLGWRPDSTTHQEKLISALGTTLALILLYWITHLVMSAESALWVTGSMGASAVHGSDLTHHNVEGVALRGLTHALDAQLDTLQHDVEALTRECIDDKRVGGANPPRIL